MSAPVYTVLEVAERLRVGNRSVYRLIEDGHLRAVKIGRLVRIPESALNDFLAGDEEAAPVGAETAPVVFIKGALDEVNHA